MRAAMKHRGPVRVRAVLGLVLTAVWVTAVVARSAPPETTMPPTTTTSSPKAAPQQPATPPAGMKLPPVSQAQAGATYVGDETCLTCHE
jgi:hypothetical protein